MLGVGDRVADDVLEEDLEHTAGLFVDETGDTLHSSTAGEAADGGLGDTCGKRRNEGGKWGLCTRRTLDVVAKNLAVALSSALSETLIE